MKMRYSQAQLQNLDTFSEFLNPITMPLPNIPVSPIPHQIVKYIFNLWIDRESHLNVWNEICDCGGHHIHDTTYQLYTACLMFYKWMVSQLTTIILGGISRIRIYTPNHSTTHQGRSPNLQLGIALQLSHLAHFCHYFQK